MIFTDRSEAGKRLAVKLKPYRNKNPIILALPRGGVPVGFEVAKILHAPLEVVVARKIGAPSNAELGIGAISEEGVKVLDEDTIALLGLSEDEIKDVVEREERELKRRIDFYRQGKPLPNFTGKTAILVDDGLATGVTAKAATLAVKKLNPRKIIFATPVCAKDSTAKLSTQIDSVICIFKPFEFRAVGPWYKEFKQVSDEEVVDKLKKAKKFI
ncbi:MAG: phosphoribosyltransferase [Candidatus Daviesbacteria bacterium]|nr:MAG: phosphoribosyltransferase [Candidatus Daviesbacteria bacterium]